MFNSLTGTLTEKRIDTICLATGGLEWEIAFPSRSVEGLPETGTRIRVFTYLNHREDQLTLFGFSSQKEREAFLQLLKVDSVGPRLALKILSGIDVDAFAGAVEQDDLSTLTSVPGLGKKTAQKILLTLKGRLQSTERVGDHAEIVTALVDMGFDRREAGEAVRRTAGGLDADSLPPAEFERELIRLSIRALSGSGTRHE